MVTEEVTKSDTDPSILTVRNLGLVRSAVLFKKYDTSAAHGTSAWHGFGRTQGSTLADITHTNVLGRLSRAGLYS